MNDSTSVATDSLLNTEQNIQQITPAAAIHRGAIERKHELKQKHGTSQSSNTNSLGMEVAIGRLDLALHNLDKTAMILEST